MWYWNPRKERKRGQGFKNLCEIIDENLPNLVRDTSIQIQDVLMNPKKDKLKDVPRHIMVKLLTTKDKKKKNKKTLKAKREK